MKYIITEEQYKKLSKSYTSIDDSELYENILPAIKKILSKYKTSVSPTVKTLPKFKNYDEAILFFEKKKKNFDSDWSGLMKKFRNKEIDAEQYTNGLRILQKQHGIKDIHYFTNRISELKDKKRIAGLKSLVGNAQQQKILTNYNQLGKNISSGGSNNLGVFDLGNGFVAKKSTYGWKDDSISLLKYKDKIKSPRVSKTVQIKNLPDPNGKEYVYIVQQKADGKPMSQMSVDEIKKIPEIHVKNFEKDLNELKNIGIDVDPSKMDNFIYNPNKGIQLIDLNVGNYLSQPGRIEHTIKHVLKR